MRFSFPPLRSLAGVPCLVVLPLAGCTPPAPPATPAAAPPAAVEPAATVAGAQDHAHAEHDHGDAHDHDEPSSFADGVAKLESLAADLADKLADGAGEAADDAVHDLGHLLEEVREFAAKEKLEAASKGLDELEACFGAVDEAFHSGDASADPKKVLESVKERLQAAFAELKEVGR